MVQNIDDWVRKCSFKNQNFSVVLVLHKQWHKNQIQVIFYHLQFVGPHIDEIWLTFCGKGGRSTYYCLSESRRGCNGLLEESLIGSQPYPFKAL